VPPLSLAGAMRAMLVALKAGGEWRTDGPARVDCRVSPPQAYKVDTRRAGWRLRVGERQLDHLRLTAVNEHGVAGGGFAADDRQGDGAEAWGHARRAHVPQLALAEHDRVARLGRLAQSQAAQMAVRLAPVVQPRHGLLAHVAALGEAHGPLVDAGLLGNG